jgi:predicted AAA+ superfamily ATPase
MLARVLGFFAAKDPDFQQKPGENSDRSSEDEPEILSKTEHSEILRGLLEYTRFPHGQGFAVVLNGPWGSGKTKFIQQNLQHFYYSTIRWRA